MKHMKERYEELELEIYQNCVKDTIIDDAFDFLLFAKRHGLKVYIYSNSTFSKRALTSGSTLYSSILSLCATLSNRLGMVVK